MCFDRVGAYTNDQGRFRVECLGAGDFQIHVDATPQGFARTRRGISLNGSLQTSQMNFALKKGVAISGKFVDEEGRQVEIAASNTFGFACLLAPNNRASSSFSGWSNRYAPHSVGPANGVNFLPGDGVYPSDDMIFPDASSFLINGMTPGTILLSFNPYTRGKKVSKILCQGKDVRESGIQTNSGDVITDVEIVIAGDERPKPAPAPLN